MEEEKTKPVKIVKRNTTFLSLLFLLFLGLKLTGVIDWSWWFITMPLWGGWALILGIFLLIGFIGLLFHTF